MRDCVFCKIVKGEIPSKIEKGTKNFIVFKDIHPQAPTHLLIVPKKHLTDIREDRGIYWAAIRNLAVKIAAEKKLKSFRLVHNVGDAAAVKHYHVHFLGKVGVDRAI